MIGVLPGVLLAYPGDRGGQVDPGHRRSLSGRLLSYDALEMSFREMRIPKDKECPMCGAKVDQPASTTSNTRTPALSPTRPPRLRISFGRPGVACTDHIRLQG